MVDVVEFINRLPDIDFKDAGSGSDVSSALNAEAGGADLATFLGLFSKNKTFSSWTHLISEWRVFTDRVSSFPDESPREGPAWDALLSDFKDQIAVTAGGGDFSLITTDENDPIFDDMLDSFMTEILGQYPFDPGGAAVTLGDFETYIGDALTVTAFLLTASASGSITTFQDYYNGFFDPSGFADKLTSFLSAKIADKTLFTPSLIFEEWTREVSNDYKLTQRFQLSPDEVDRRQILFTVFDLLIDMLKALQETVAAQSNTVVFLAKWQKEYTEVLGRVPIYTEYGTTPTDANGEYRSADGFMGLSYEELRQMEEEWEQMESFGVDAPNSGHVQVSWNQDQIGLVSLDQNGWASELISRFGDNTGGHIARGIDSLITQRYQGGNTTNVDRRSAQNQLMNQYIENIRGKRSVIKDRAKQAETTLNQSNEAINQQSNLMTSIMQQLSTMLQAIFR